MAGKTITVLIAVGMALTACAMPNYVPMHDQNVEQAAADRLYCKGVAEGMTPAQGGGFVYAQGSPQFVGATMGAYAVAGLIGVAVRQQHKLDNYDDCMTARGYQRQSTLAQSPTTPQATGGGHPTPAAVQKQIVVASTNTAVTPPRAKLLVQAVDVTPALADTAHLIPPRGVMITLVGDGGVAMLSGLRERDVILDFNGSPVSHTSDLQRSLNEIPSGSTIKARVWRDGTEKFFDLRF